MSEKNFEVYMGIGKSLKMYLDMFAVTGQEANGPMALTIRTKMGQVDVDIPEDYILN